MSADGAGGGGRTADFVVVGAGVIGLTCALELARAYPTQSVSVWYW